jgi:hypothetical protein
MPSYNLAVGNLCENRDLLGFSEKVFIAHRLELPAG